MKDFILDTNIANDSCLIKNLKLSQLRLIKDGEITWFLLVPQRANIIELIDLERDDQLLLLEEINLVSSKLKTVLKPDKINIGSLGNIVPQFHLHLISRSKNDRAWPGPIWGSKRNTNFNQDQVEFWKKEFEII